MPEIRYGTARDPKWIAMVAGGCVLVVTAGLPQERLEDLWDLVSTGKSTQPVLDALTRGGISTTPDFVLGTFAPVDGVAAFEFSVIVRGSLAVRVHSADEQAEISGAGVSTWFERTVPNATLVQVGARAAESLSATAPGYALVGGSAPIAWLSLGSLAMSGPAAESSAIEALPAARLLPAQRIAKEPVTDTIVDPGITISDATIATPPPGDDPDGGYDFLFGETVVRTVEGAAVREDAGAVAGDHDGKTAVGLTAAERRAARAARPARNLRTVAQSSFSLEFSTGEKEILDQTLIIGRAPSAGKVSASSVPRLVTVGGPDQDISRNHVQVSVEGETVMVTDLQSRNGTLVTFPGRPPQQLRGGQPTAVLVGSVVDLGSGVSFTVGKN
ncbi:MAG TPA: FHA domain-containing protein [Galbitalea sp.]|nr:FHA domain-containing protein [Galbitalea sp.]